MSPKLLYIEDDPVSRLVFSKAIGESAILSMRTSISECCETDFLKNYDIIFVDYALPDGSAIDLIQFAKSHQLNIPIIVISKFSENRVIYECWKSGAFDFLEKPVDRNALMHLIEIASTFPGSYFNRELSVKTFQDQELTQTLNLDALLKTVCGDETLLRQVLEMAHSEIQQCESALNTLALCEHDDLSVDSVTFHLHRLSSIAKNISAERITAAVFGIEKSTQRGEKLQPSDLRHLNSLVKETLHIIDEKIGSRRELSDRSDAKRPIK